MRILVTNDDGIDSIGLHVLATAMRPHGDVVVVAPDREFSGASAAVGALHLIHPDVRRAAVDGIDEAWSVDAPPALCVLFARLGVFGPRFDLVVSGINPGANVGRAVYHSGTVGAVVTGRLGGMSGVAVSQAVTGFGVEGQGWDEMLADQHWDSAAHAAGIVVGALVHRLPPVPVVVNVNVPNLPVEDFKGWRHAEVGREQPRSVSNAELVPVEGTEGSFTVRMSYGDPIPLPEYTDGGAIERDQVAVTYLSAYTHEDRPDLAAVGEALDAGLIVPVNG